MQLKNTYKTVGGTAR